MFEPIFPGVDPFIEDQRWMAFHNGMVIRIQDELAQLLAPQYDVVAESYVHLMRPDVSVYGGLPNSEPLQRSQVAIAEATRIMNPTIYEEETQPRVEIYNALGKLVTVVELLLPSNKSDKSRERYLANRDALLTSDVNLVEIDWLRAGKRTESSFPQEGYIVLVARALLEREHQGEVYEIGVRDPLPVIPVPLGTIEPDVPLDLPKLFRQAYIDARYRLLLKYQNLPKMPFSPADESWVKQLVAQALGHPN